MISIDQIERILITVDDAKLLEFLQEHHLVHPEKLCTGCNSYMSINKYKKTIDGFEWRCATRTCPEFKKYVSIRKDIFIENLRLDIRYILRVIFKYASLQPRHSIKRSLDINKNTVTTVISTLINKMPASDFSQNKLEGPKICSDR